MAEGILRHRLGPASSITVASMGIHGLEQQPASSAAVAVCAEHGIDISAHRSRPLLGDELMGADAIFALELLHKEFLITFFPQVSERVYQLGAWPGKQKRKHNVRDPIGRSGRVYRIIFEQISEHIERIAPLLQQHYDH